jgi:hypothetical protein
VYGIDNAAWFSSRPFFLSGDVEETATEYEYVLGWNMKWLHEPESLTFLQDRAIRETDREVRMTAIEVMLRNWANNPDVLAFFQHLAVSDADDEVREKVSAMITWRGAIRADILPSSIDNPSDE